MSGTLGSHATTHRGATHPDRQTGGIEAPTPPSTDQPEREVPHPSRDDVHEQRAHEQPREATVPAAPAAPPRRR